MVRVLRAALLPALLLCPLVALRAQTAADRMPGVRYEIEAQLFPERHALEGRQRLTLINHTPDTLRSVFYHLYYNAFQPGSLMAARNRALPDPDPRIAPRIFLLAPDEQGRQDVHGLRQDGRPLAPRISDTVLEAALARPLAPGDSSVLEMTFRTQIPLLTRRGGRDSPEGVDYSMSQWYPKLAAYDRRGWRADPYVGREFYAPFARFDVRLKLPARYVVGATGALMNPEEVGHGYAADSAHVRADTLRWHFRADRVHDFAWAADPDYRHDRIDGPGGRTYHLLYLPDVATAWRPMRDFLPWLFDYLEARIGPYPYPDFTLAQAGDGGMEYPGIVFVTGRRSRGSLFGTTAHEAAHQWFYGVLASDETRYAWIDEGLTNFVANDAMAAYEKRPEARHDAALLDVVRMAMRGEAEALSTPSDWFQTNAAYGAAAYSGGETLAQVLGYVISDSLRDAWLRRLYRDYAFTHPDPRDLEAAAEAVSGLRLDWYFDQMTGVPKLADYAVAGLSSAPEGGLWRTRLRLRRRGALVLPVDAALTLEGGGVVRATIPTSEMLGGKPTPPGWITAPAWPWTARTYTLELMLPRRAVDARLDPALRTPEANRLNDAHRFPLCTAFLHPPAPAWSHYSLGWRPAAWYARGFGGGAGVHAAGAYAFEQRRLHAGATVWPAVLAGAGEAASRPERYTGIDFGVRYATDPEFSKGRASTTLQAEQRLGVVGARIAQERLLGRARRPSGPRLTLAADAYLGARGNLTGRYPGGGLPDDHLGARAWAALDGRRRAAALGLRAEVGSLLEVGGQDAPVGWLRAGMHAERTATRGAWRGGATLAASLGTRRLPAYRRALPGGVPALEAWESAAYRSLAAPLPLAHTRRVYATDGAGPLAYGLGRAFAGARRLAATLEWGRSPAPGVRLLRPLVAAAYAAAGATGGASGQSGAFLAEAGGVLRLPVYEWAPLRRWTRQSEALQQLALELRLPLWLSDPQDADARGPVAVRWLVGVRL